MKNQYVADINDFRKYGLIRSLLKNNSLRCGVFWMLTDRDSSQDGELVAYLKRPEKNAHLDQELFHKLRALVHDFEDRTVARVRQEGVLPRSQYFEELIPDDASLRASIFRKGLLHLRDSDLVFFDPDNGLEIRSRRRGQKLSSKYLYLDEVQATFQEGHSLLIYQHFPRIERSTYIQNRIGQLRDRLGRQSICTFSSGYVCFLLVMQSHHQTELLGNIEQFKAQWGSHFAVAIH